jgi:hypothetical protein
MASAGTANPAAAVPSSGHASPGYEGRTGIGQVTKLSVLARLGLFLQSGPLAISQSKDQTAVHEGEVFAGVQSVLFFGGQSRPLVVRESLQTIGRTALCFLSPGISPDNLLLKWSPRDYSQNHSCRHGRVLCVGGAAG